MQDMRPKENQGFATPSQKKEVSLGAKRLAVSIILALLGLLAIGLNWYKVATQNTYYIKVGLLGPILLVFAVDIVLFKRPLRPPPEARQLKGLALGQWIAIIIGLALGGLNLQQLSDPYSFTRLAVDRLLGL